MSTFLISIISDQTIPNVLFIKELGKVDYRYIFLTTEAMEKKGKSDAVMDTCGLGSVNVTKIVIQDDQTDSIKAVLYKNGFATIPQAHFLINITGGTKLMSLAVYEFFRNHHTTFYYLPIGKNKIQKFGQQFIEESLALQCRLTLHEYLVAFSLSYEIKENFAFTPDQSDKLFEDYKALGFRFDFFPVEKASKMAAFRIMPENIRGVWFEEFVYHLIRRKYNLKDESIACSVKVFKDMEIGYNDNEFDVMYVKDNELFVVECKVALSGKSAMQKLDTSLYKLGAINKNFGLKTTTFLYTLGDLRNRSGQLSEALLRKCELLNIQPPFDMSSFQSDKLQFKK